MTVEIATLISVLSVVSAIFFSALNSKRADKSEIEKKATETAVINVKLDDIGQDVKDIKYDISTVKTEQQNMRERMIATEQSTKSAHHRLDTLEKKLNMSTREEREGI